MIRTILAENIFESIINMKKGVYNEFRTHKEN